MNYINVSIVYTYADVTNTIILSAVFGVSANSSIEVH